MFLLIKEDGSMQAVKELHIDDLQSCADGTLVAVRQKGAGYEELTVEVIEAEGDEEEDEFEEIWTEI